MSGPRFRRVGLIGFGKLARDFYAPILRRRQGLRVAIVADPLAASREAARRSFPDAEIVSEAEAVFEAAPDALLVASPPSTHLGLWNRAAGSGLPVFLEKPFVLPGELACAAPDPSALLTVNLNRRFWPPYRRMRDWLRAGRLGSLRAARFQLHVPVLDWCRVTAHRLDPREGGALADLGSQMFDLADYLLGELPTAMTGSLESRRWTNDRVKLRVVGRDGAAVAFDLAYAERAVEAVELSGSEATLRLRNPNLALHLTRGAERPGWASGVRDVLALGPRALLRSRSMTRFTIAASLGAFLEHRAAPERVGYREAARHVVLLEAAVHALGSGR